MSKPLKPWLLSNSVTSSQANLTWGPNTADPNSNTAAYEYELVEVDQNGTYIAQFSFSPATATSGSWIKPPGTYYLYVVAKNLLSRGGFVQSDPSATIKIVIPQPVKPLKPWVRFDSADNQKANLTWGPGQGDPNNTALYKYFLEQVDKNGNPIGAKISEGNKTSGIFTHIPAIYWIRVYADNGGVLSDPSDPAISEVSVNFINDSSTAVLINYMTYTTAGTLGTLAARASQTYTIPIASYFTPWVTPRPAGNSFYPPNQVNVIRPKPCTAQPAQLYGSTIIDQPNITVHVLQHV